MLLGLLLGFYGMAAGAGLSVFPGLGLTLAPCQAEVDAACWETAARAERFALPRGEGLAHIEADVRLARRGGVLLVRVASLPEGAQVEVTVDGPKLSRSMKRASYGRGGEGIIAVPAGLETGKPRTLRMAVLLPDGTGIRPMYWAPAGPAEPAKTIVALPVKDLGEDPVEPVIRLEDGMVMLEAEGAFEITLTEERDHQHPALWREAGPAWTLNGEPPMLTALPVDGIYELVATYGTPAAPQRRISRRFHYEAPLPQPVQSHGIMPAPRRLVEGQGEFALGSQARIVLAQPEWSAAAELLADELERFTGIRPEVVEGHRARRGDLWLGPLAARSPVRADWPDDQPVAEGFALNIDPARAAVGALDLRGAIYGALALADALGPDARCPALQATDWPETTTRILSHRVDSAGDHIDVEFYQDFLRRVVARGRYNTFVLILRNYYKYESVEKVGRGRGWNRTDVERVLEVANALGLEVIPGANVPIHADWLGNHAALFEGKNRSLICTRHPELWPLLDSIYTELIDIFGNPRYFHVGHDEVYWATERWHPVDRCPRCEATPRYVLFADDIERHIEYFSSRGITPLFWSDALVEGWNGGREGLHRALDLLPEAARTEAVFVGWSIIGDPVGTMSEAGFRSMFVMTGARDVRREFLADPGAAEGLGLALWTPVPWSAFGPAQTSQQPRYHWSQIIITGASAWDPRLAPIPAAKFLRAIADTPAMHPGFQAIGDAEPTPLALSGPPARPQIDLPDSITVGGVSFGGSSLIAVPEDGLEVPIEGQVAGLSLLHGLIAPSDRQKILRRALKSALPADGVPAVWLELQRADGTEETVPLGFGIDTWNIDGDERIQALWGTAGTARITHPDGGELLLWRWDWHNPSPQTPITALRIGSSTPGLELLLAGISTWAPAEP